MEHNFYTCIEHILVNTYKRQVFTTVLALQWE